MRRQGGPDTSPQYFVGAHEITDLCPCAAAKILVLPVACRTKQLTRVGFYRNAQCPQMPHRSEYDTAYALLTATALSLSICRNFTKRHSNQMSAERSGQHSSPPASRSGTGGLIFDLTSKASKLFGHRARVKRSEDGTLQVEGKALSDGKDVRKSFAAQYPALRSHKCTSRYQDCKNWKMDSKGHARHARGRWPLQPRAA